MKPVKLTVPLLIGTTHHDKGAVVMLPDVRAAELVRLGHAESHDGSAEVANPDHNTLADVIEPEPPGGLTINPVDALSPTVQDNPGLVKTVEIAPTAIKSAKVKPEQVAEGQPAAKVEDKTTPTTTTAEVTLKAN